MLTHWCGKGINRILFPQENRIQAHIVLLLAKHHGMCMPERTLKRKLKDFGLHRRQNVDGDRDDK